MKYLNKVLAGRLPAFDAGLVAKALDFIKDKKAYPSYSQLGEEAGSVGFVVVFRNGEDAKQAAKDLRSLGLHEFEKYVQAGKDKINVDITGLKWLKVGDEFKASATPEGELKKERALRKKQGYSF